MFEDSHGCGHLPPGLLGSNVQPDAPGIEDVKDTELPLCGCDFSPRTRYAAMVVAWAARARMKMRTRGRTCFLWNIVVSCELQYQMRCEARTRGYILSLWFPCWFPWRSRFWRVNSSAMWSIRKVDRCIQSRSTRCERSQKDLCCTSTMYFRSRNKIIDYCVAIFFLWKKSTAIPPSFCISSIVFHSNIPDACLARFYKCQPPYFVADSVWSLPNSIHWHRVCAVTAPFFRTWTTFVILAFA